MARLWFALLLLLPTLSARADRAALVIVDMQPYFTTRLGQSPNSSNDRKIEAVVARQRELIRLAKANRMNVVVVEYRGYGATFAGLTEEIGAYEKARTISKTHDGLFDRRDSAAREMKTYLLQNRITDLVVVGANGSGCVAWTIQGGLRHDLRVWTEAKATIDFDHDDYEYPFSHAPLKDTLKQIGLVGGFRLNGVEAVFHESARDLARAERAACEIAMTTTPAPVPNLWRRLVDGWRTPSPELSPQR